MTQYTMSQTKPTRGNKPHQNHTSWLGEADDNDNNDGACKPHSWEGERSCPSPGMTQLSSSPGGRRRLQPWAGWELRHPLRAPDMSDSQFSEPHFRHRIHSYLCYLRLRAWGHSNFMLSVRQQSLFIVKSWFHIRSQAFQLRLNSEWFLKIKDNL